MRISWFFQLCRIIYHMVAAIHGHFQNKSSRKALKHNVRFPKQDKLQKKLRHVVYRTWTTKLKCNTLRASYFMYCVFNKPWGHTHSFHFVRVWPDAEHLFNLSVFDVWTGLQLIVEVPEEKWLRRHNTEGPEGTEHSLPFSEVELSLWVELHDGNNQWTIPPSPAGMLRCLINSSGLPSSSSERDRSHKAQTK